MKKPLYLLSCVAITLGLLSCQAKKQEQEKSEPEPQKPAVTANVTYHILGGSDIISIFDVTVEYTAENGERKQETVTELPWEKPIQAVSVPFIANLKVDCKEKPEIVDQPKYQVGVGGSISYKTSLGHTKNFRSVATMFLPKSKIDTYVKTKGGLTEYTEEIE
jgi:hypothetical protein